MKIVAVYLLLFCSSFLVNGQITQVGQLNSGPINQFNLSHLSNGYKLTCVIDTFYESTPGNWINEHFIRVFDLNGNIEKNIILPTYNWSNYGDAKGVPRNISLLSDQLFNSDGNIEFLVEYVGHSSDNCGISTRDSNVFYVMNEIGNILATLSSSMSCYSNGIYSANYISDGSTFSKLIILGSNDFIYNIFDLPGFLPCETCSSSIGIKNPNNGSTADGMRIGVYPNPSANEFIFQYELPKNKNTGELIISNLNGVVVKTSNINNQTGSISINMSELSSGVYIYKLKSGDKYSNPQKIILTK